MDERLGEHQAAFLPAGELVHAGEAPLPQPKALQQLVGSEASLARGNPTVARLID
jgi:hypothetical protein